MTTITAEPVPVLQGFEAIGIWTMTELRSDPQAKQSYDYLWGRYLSRGTGSATGVEISNTVGPSVDKPAARRITLVQRILGTLEGETTGLTIPEIALETGYSEERVRARTSAMVERGEIYEDNGRYILGAKAAVRRRGRPRGAAASGTNGGERQSKVTQTRKSAGEISVADATLNAVTRMPGGANAAQILRHIKEEYGMTVRPNHLGIALQRHRRAGRLLENNGIWLLPAASQGQEAAA